MSLLDKLAEVADIAKSEYQRHFGDEDPDGVHEGGFGTSDEGGAAFLPAIRTPEQAYERLELSASASLDEVRARYREVAQLWHPRAQQDGEAADRARKHLDGYLDALEVLEEHLLPLP
jgi:DnaJ-class molecular chaperone